MALLCLAAAPSPRLIGAKALGVLRSALADPDADVRALAVEAFGGIGNRATVPLLKNALNDEDRSVQIAAGEALARLGDPAGIAALERLGSEKAPTDDGSAPAAVRELRVIAHAKTRASALRALLRVNPVKSERVFRRARRDKVGVVRDAGAAALARLGDREQLETFLTALKDEDEAVRLQAVRSLGEVATADVLAPLVIAAGDPSSDVRAAALAGLGALGTLETLPPLKAALRDKSELVRGKAVEALARLTVPGGGGALESERDRPGNPYLQLVALEGLARLGRHVELGLAVRSLSQKDVDARLAAVGLLEVVRREESIELLHGALADGDARVRVRAAAALIKRLAKTPPPEPAAPGRDGPGESLRAPPPAPPPAAKGDPFEEAVPEAPPELAP